MGRILVNRYRLIKEIGRGGTGIIYLAEDLHLGRYVAVKQLMISGQSLQMNRNEADLLKLLHHTNLPQVYDYLTVDGCVYTVVEYIRGRDLTAYLPQETSNVRISEEVLLDWLLQLCDVLEYLHSQSVIHSDIKPSNIIITPEGRVMLIDFNISFLYKQGLKGYSDHYASPEQIQQARAIGDWKWNGAAYIDARTDIYSVSATFYHLLSGRAPLAGQANVLLAQMNLPYQKEFLQILDRGMAMKPSRRYVSARQMKERLLQWKSEQNREKRTIWQQLVFGGVGIFLIAAGLTCILIGQRQMLQDEYNRTFRQISASFAQWDLDQVYQQGTAFLEEGKFAALHEQHPSRTAEVYLLLGESRYWQEEYALAAEEYEKAVKLAPQEEYLKRYVVALLKADRIEQAESVVQEYDAYLSGQQETTFLQAEIAYQTQDYQEVLDLVRQDGNAGEDQTLLELGAMAAQKLGDLETCEQYVAQCYDLTGNGFYLRWRGEICYLLTRQHAGSAIEQQWIREALHCYERLCDSSFATEEDELWRVVLSLEAGEDGEAKQSLEGLAEQSTDLLVRFRANLYLALWCSQRDTGEKEWTQFYCQRAVELYGQLNKIQASQIDPNDLMQLQTMAGQYGYALQKR